MRGSRGKEQQYGGERPLLYKKESKSNLNSLVNFAVHLDPRMNFLCTGDDFIVKHAICPDSF